MSIVEVGSLYRLKRSPEKLFVVLSVEIESKIKTGNSDPVYLIKCLATSGKIFEIISGFQKDFEKIA